MIALHPFSTSRESVLSMWSQQAQTRRMQADSSASELFVLLHGMLFTNIQLDDFRSVQARLLERLSIDAPEGREWTMMACVNIAAVLEYGKPTGAIKRTGALGGTIVGSTTGSVQAQMAKVKLAKKDISDGMDVDGVSEQRRSLDGPAGSTSPAISEAQVNQENAPASFTLALELTFSMLSHAIDHLADSFSYRGGGTGRPVPNAYITVILTFLATLLKHPGALAVMEKMVPWDKLATLMRGAPSRVLKREDGASDKLGRRAALPEDWYADFCYSRTHMRRN
jgi:protein SMG6